MSHPHALGVPQALGPILLLTLRASSIKCAHLQLSCVTSHSAPPSHLPAARVTFIFPHPQKEQGQAPLTSLTGHTMNHVSTDSAFPPAGPSDKAVTSVGRGFWHPNFTSDSLGVPLPWLGAGDILLFPHPMGRRGGKKLLSSVLLSPTWQQPATRGPHSPHITRMTQNSSWWEGLFFGIS